MKMKFIIALFVVITATYAKAQTVNVSYFEVYTKLAHKHGSGGFSFNKDSILARINNIPDTADTYATFVVAVNDPSQVDSLFFTLTNSQGSQAYNATVKLSTLAGNPNFRQSDKTLYFTVGPYPYLKHFTATAKVRSVSGAVSPVKSFSKN